MLESSIMEYVKWFIGIVSVVFVSTMVVFMFQLNEVNTFQQEVNYQIERHGGLTTDALEDLNNHAKNNYGGYLYKSKDSTEPLFPADAGGSASGFFVQEVKENGSDYNWYNRVDQARYGVSIKYAIVRRIGNQDSDSLFSFLNPTVMGESASRVRGTSDE